MGLKNKYTLDFTHPPVATETIHYELDKAFIDGIEDSILLDADVTLELTIEPLTDQRYQLNLVYDGEVVVECDRCLQPLSLPMHVDEGLELILGDHLDDENDEQIILDAQDPVYDFSWIFYELLALHLPIQRTHDIEDCDPEFVKYLVNELPEETQPEDDDNVDPIWQSLKDKMDKNNNN
ncbi:DUF177 domain-containing protein [Porphyromonadaceae bacterium W3.11]|nr:DUF177 domain-containing protein [Porphyromonadaceae bacterium W3.11]